MRESDTFHVHVVSHTHWDREWYLPAGRFRQRLVALIDELLDRPPAPRQHFLLDGQAVVLEDYLAVRPDRRETLAARLRDGNLEAGPWYVLADELIPSGEALVRNLLAGRRTLATLGASPPSVLYSPDAFGHPATLPIIAGGFGCRLVILWRGLAARDGRRATRFAGARPTAPTPWCITCRATATSTAPACPPTMTVRAPGGGGSARSWWRARDWTCCSS